MEGLIESRIRALAFRVTMWLGWRSRPTLIA